MFWTEDDHDQTSNTGDHTEHYRQDLGFYGDRWRSWVDSIKIDSKIRKTSEHTLLKDVKYRKTILMVRFVAAILLQTYWISSNAF